jgi:hypothetical protein
MKRHGGSRRLFFESQNSRTLAIFLLLNTPSGSPLFAIRQPREPQLFFFSLLESKRVWWASLPGKQTLSHQLLETLLLFMARTKRILCGWSTWRTTILYSFSSSRDANWRFLLVLSCGIAGRRPLIIIRLCSGRKLALDCIISWWKTPARSVIDVWVSRWQVIKQKFISIFEWVRRLGLRLLLWRRSSNTAAYSAWMKGLTGKRKWIMIV